MNKLITTEEEYNDALKQLEECENDEYKDFLTLLIQDYEVKNFDMEYPDPIKAIKIRMEDLSLKKKDLILAIGSKNKVSKVLSRKKKLTVKMIRNLSILLDLSVDTLIQKYKR